MYIYIENRYFISLKEIIAIIKIEKDKKSYDKIINDKTKRIINLSEKDKKSIIITDNYIYITSYTNRALFSRGCEYDKLLKENCIRNVKLGGKNE